MLLLQQPNPRWAILLAPGQLQLGCGVQVKASTTSSWKCGFQLSDEMVYLSLLPPCYRFVLLNFINRKVTSGESRRERMCPIRVV